MFRTLTTKLAAAAIALLALVILAAVTVFVSIAKTSEATRYLPHQIERVSYSDEFVIFLDEAIAAAETYMYSRDEDDRQQALEALKGAEGSLANIQVVIVEAAQGSAELADSQRLYQQRVVVLGATRTAVMNSLASTQGNNSVLLAGNVAALEQAQRDVKALKEQADQIIHNEITGDIATVNQLFTTSLYAVGIVGTIVGSAVAALMWLLRRNIIRPITSLAVAAGQVATGNLDQHIAVSNNDEVGELQTAFGQMVASLRDQRQTLEEKNKALEASFAAHQQLFETVQQLSTPLLPVLDDVVVLPIVGHVDTQRADAIMHTLLQGVSERHARVAILDVTGIATMDTYVVKLLLQAVQAVQLLGARVMLAGISAAMAHIVVEQQLSLGSIETYRDLRSAIEEAAHVALV